jgi:DNA-binding NtrC family response regulator
VVSLTIPPLRDRSEDIPDLVRYFLQRYGREFGLESVSIQPEAVTFLQSQPWPGNVRELENILRQALLQAKPFGIALEHVQQAMDKSRRTDTTFLRSHSGYVGDLLAAVQRGEITDAYSRMIADLEPELYKQAIQLAQGNQAKAARWLGVTRLKMREKLTELGLRTPQDDTETDGELSG